MQMLHLRQFSVSIAFFCSAFTCSCKAWSSQESDLMESSSWDIRSSASDTLDLNLSMSWRIKLISVARNSILVVRVSLHALMVSNVSFGGSNHVPRL